MKKFKNLFVIFFFTLLIVGYPSKIKAASPETFTSSGTFTPLDGIYSIDVGCWGGGGGGGGSSKSKTASNGGGGGGGGAYSKTTGIGVTPTVGYSIVVGSGGSGGSAGNNGLPGTSSTFNSNFVIAVGGSGGGNGGASIGTSGLGGLASSCTGDSDKKFNGGNGATGTATAGSGGGGGAGETNSGGNASGQTAGVGGSQSGGAGGNGGASGADGSIGNILGGAGGGAGKGSQASGFIGGDGQRGQCIVTYTDVWAPSINQMTYSTTWSFVSNPTNISSTEIGMTATTGYDYTGPIKYLFTLDNTNCSVGYSGSGGTSSSWQTENSYIDTGLEINKCYGYNVISSDSAGTTHVGTVSSTYTTYTSANTPAIPVLGSATLFTLSLTNDANNNPASNPTTNFAAQVVTTIPSDSTWLNKWINTSGDPAAAEVWMSDATMDTLTLRGLKPGTIYGVKVKAKNQDNDETPFSPEGQSTTTAAIISISIDNGIVSYGILGAGVTKSTIDLSSTQIAKNEGNVAETFTIKSSNATGGIGWTLASNAGTDIFVHEFSTTAGVGWTKFTTSDVYQPFVTNIGVSGNQSFDLRITAPTLSSDGISKTINITILATQY